MMNVCPNKNNLSVFSVKSFPTFENEDENELDNSLERKNNSKFYSIIRNKSRNEKSESEVDKEYYLDYTPSFSQESESSFGEIENSFKKQNSKISI